MLANTRVYKCSSIFNSVVSTMYNTPVSCRCGLLYFIVYLLYACKLLHFFFKVHRLFETIDAGTHVAYLYAHMHLLLLFYIRMITTILGGVDDKREFKLNKTPENVIEMHICQCRKVF